MIPKTTQRIYEQCRASREADGAAIIRAKDVATLVRARLRQAFAGVKFSVRSDHNAARIHWTDGPAPSRVEEIADTYSFGGFDGSIDLAYSAMNWLLPDGSMLPAASSGTEGSMGSVSGYATDCPEPGAILVKYGPTYVFAQRHESPAFMLRLVAGASNYYGFSYDPAQPLCQQRDGERGEWITTLAFKWEREAAQVGG